MATRTFLGTVDDSWANANNWQDTTKPSASDDVVISADCTLDEASPTLHSLELSNGVHFYDVSMEIVTGTSKETSVVMGTDTLLNIHSFVCYWVDGDDSGYNDIVGQGATSVVDFHDSSEAILAFGNLIDVTLRSAGTETPTSINLVTDQGDGIDDSVHWEMDHEYLTISYDILSGTILCNPTMEVDYFKANQFIVSNNARVIIGFGSDIIIKDCINFEVSNLVTISLPEAASDDRHEIYFSILSSGATGGDFSILQAAGSIAYCDLTNSDFAYTRIKNINNDPPLDQSSATKVFDLSGNSGIVFPLYQKSRHMFPPIFFSGSFPITYIAGGWAGGSVKVTADQFLHSSETCAAHTAANLSYARWMVGNVSNHRAGYISGGVGAAIVATTDRIVYSTATGNAHTTSNLPTIMAYQASLSNGSYGYIFGGYSSGAAYLARCDRMTFSTETYATQTSMNLTDVKTHAVGILCGKVKGYIAGGNTAANSPVTQVDKFTYSTETNSSLGNVLSKARWNMGSAGNSVHGYCWGGWTAAWTATSVGDIVSTTSDVFAACMPYIGSANVRANTFSNGKSAGYNAGNQSFTSIDKLNFSTNSWSTIPATISVVRSSAGVVTSCNSDQDSTYLSPQYGYFCGGVEASIVATTDRLTFATDTTAAQTVADLSTVRQIGAGVSDKTIFGYINGGNSGSYVVTSDQITFSTSTTAAHTASDLTQARQALAGVSDGLTYGYFLGGYTGAVVDTTDRITFSVQTTAARTAANLSGPRYINVGLSDGSTFGYACGGRTGAAATSAITDRITFSTSSTAANTASDLPVGTSYTYSLSDAETYGYVLGGYTASNITKVAWRMTFSTGIFAANTASDLSGNRRSGGYCSGLVAGFISGGYTTANVSTADKLTFSTGVTAACTSADTTASRRIITSTQDYHV